MSYKIIIKIVSFVVVIECFLEVNNVLLFRINFILENKKENFVQCDVCTVSLYQVLSLSLYTHYCIKWCLYSITVSSGVCVSVYLVSLYQMLFV